MHIIYIYIYIYMYIYIYIYIYLKEQYICLLDSQEDSLKNNGYCELDITAFCCYKKFFF